MTRLDAQVEPMLQRLSAAGDLSLVSDGRTASVHHQRRQRDWFFGVITERGPACEDDYDDARYWVRRVNPHRTQPQSTSDADAHADIVRFEPHGNASASDDAQLSILRRFWITATNIAELNMSDAEDDRPPEPCVVSSPGVAAAQVEAFLARSATTPSPPPDDNVPAQDPFVDDTPEPDPEPISVSAQPGGISTEPPTDIPPTPPLITSTPEPTQEVEGSIPPPIFVPSQPPEDDTRRPARRSTRETGTVEPPIDDFFVPPPPPDPPIVPPDIIDTGEEDAEPGPIPTISVPPIITPTPAPPTGTGGIGDDDPFTERRGVGVAPAPPPVETLTKGTHLLDPGTVVRVYPISRGSGPYVRQFIFERLAGKESTTALAAAKFRLLGAQVSLTQNRISSQQALPITSRDFPRSDDNFEGMGTYRVEDGRLIFIRSGVYELSVEFQQTIIGVIRRIDFSAIPGFSARWGSAEVVSFMTAHEGPGVVIRSSDRDLGFTVLKSLSRSTTVSRAIVDEGNPTGVILGNGFAVDDSTTTHWQSATGLFNVDLRGVLDLHSVAVWATVRSSGITERVGISDASLIVRRVSDSL